MLYEITIPQFTKMLRNLDVVLGKGQTFAESKKIEMSVLLNSRLAPDQFNLLRQVQIACDTAKLGISRLTGKDAPKHEDNEATVAELRARIQSVIGYFSEFSAKDFEGALERSNFSMQQRFWKELEKVLRNIMRR